MTRKGRDLEKVVALLENYLGKQGVQIKSPEYFIGKISNSRIEVDVTLRSKIGSSDILVMVECRDRDNEDGEGLDWIQQLASKREDVGADKVMAVVSSRFTSGAINFARNKNIELRTLEYIDPYEILLWFGFEEFTRFKQYVNFINISIVVPNISNIELPTEINIETIIFQRKTDRSLASFWDVWIGLEDELKEIIYTNIVPSGPKTKKPIILNFVNENDRFQLITKSGPIDIIQFKINTELWIEVDKVPIKSVRQYRKDNKILIQTAEFLDLEHKITIQIHQVPQVDRQFISIIKNDSEEKTFNPEDQLSLELDGTEKEKLKNKIKLKLKKADKLDK